MDPCFLLHGFKFCVKIIVRSQVWWDSWTDLEPSAEQGPGGAEQQAAGRVQGGGGEHHSCPWGGNQSCQTPHERKSSRGNKKQNIFQISWFVKYQHFLIKKI